MTRSWFELEMMLQRQREGIAKAKAAGLYRGHGPAVRMRAAESLSMGAIATRFSIDRASVHRAISKPRGAE